MTITDQPLSRSCSCWRWSRWMFCSNFLLQKSSRVFGVVVWRHPGCRCQKQPCTNTTVLYLGRTMSGDPGRSRRWSL